jgi:Ca2+-transporting ATPase
MTSAIVAIVTINATIGVMQESKAEAALDALKSMSTVKATVIRDGQPFLIESAELVQGDLVVLKAGDAVPADLRLTETHDLESREAPLTGEPEPVKKSAQ